MQLGNLFLVVPWPTFWRQTDLPNCACLAIPLLWPNFDTQTMAGSAAPTMLFWKGTSITPK